MAFGSLLAAADRVVLGHLGDAIRYRSEYGDPVDVTGVFSNAYQLGTVNEIGVENTSPAVWFRLSDLAAAGVPDPDEDDPRITKGEMEYRVRERKKDGEGGILLMLTEA